MSDLWPTSIFHHYLGSCLLSSVQTGEFMTQIFLAHSGTLWKLFRNIMSMSLVQDYNFQMDYDIIGAIIKHNLYTTRIFNLLFVRASSPFHFFQRLTDVSRSALFIRGLVLSHATASLIAAQSDPENLEDDSILDLEIYKVIEDYRGEFIDLLFDEVAGKEITIESTLAT